MNKFPFPVIIENIADYTHNQTRFIAIARGEKPQDLSKKYKTSIVIIEETDRPGMLTDILAD